MTDSSKMDWARELSVEELTMVGGGYGSGGPGDTAAYDRAMLEAAKQNFPKTYEAWVAKLPAPGPSTQPWYWSESGRKAEYEYEYTALFHPEKLPPAPHPGGPGGYPGTGGPGGY